PRHRGRQLPARRGRRGADRRRRRRHQHLTSILIRSLLSPIPSVPRTEGVAVADTEYRIEHDTMGEVRVPKNALYAAQTQRAVENFPISGDVLEPAQIVALARIKKAAALANK